jgi:hypothetical protein
MTGSGVSITRLGAPDVALLSFSEIVDQAKRMADVTTIPIIADADTGYGGPLNVIRTVREFERAGISGIQIEDQAWPKRCGHEPGRRIVSTAEMVGRIKAAVDTRHDPNVVIIARTDARSDLGINAAIERSQRYAEAGADVCFLESPESADEMRLLNQQVKIPTLANLVEGGRTPMLPVDMKSWRARARARRSRIAWWIIGPSGIFLSTRLSWSLKAVMLTPPQRSKSPRGLSRKNPHTFPRQRRPSGQGRGGCQFKRIPSSFTKGCISSRS